MSKRGSNSEPFAHENDALTARPQLQFFQKLLERIMYNIIYYHVINHKLIYENSSVKTVN